MDASQYNYFIQNEPNFQSLNEWVNNYSELELVSDPPFDNTRYFEQNLRPIAGLDPELDFIQNFKRK